MKILLSLAFMLLVLVAGLSLPLLWDPGAMPIPSPKRWTLVDPVYDMQIHQDEKLALIRTLRHVSVRDVSTGELVHGLSREPFELTSVAWVPGTEQVLVGCRDGRLLLTERFSNPREVSPDTGHTTGVLLAAVTASGQIAVTASEDCLCVWHLEQGRRLAMFPLNNMLPCLLELFPDEQRFLLGTRDGLLQIFDLEDCRVIHSCQPVGDMLVSARLIDNSRKILAVYFETIIIIDTAAGEFREIPAPCRGSFIDLDVSPDEKLFACSDWSKVIYVFSLETGEKIATLEGHTDGVSILKFSTKEPWLYSAGYDGTVRVWDLKTRTEISAYTVNL